MVVRRRLRAFAVPLVIYVMAGGCVGYFLHNAKVGKRGLTAKQELKVQIVTTQAELETARTQHADWDRRLALMRADQVDRDLLEERARAVLGRVHRNDAVIFQ